ncbi:hypothetical protein QFC21_006695 [Naganishia friedmannii]|uniref:Uncharacterized protein n=1 Tax=Naganishia friedmannii TaxID=89922 RepID=A0ACC2V1D3_9TREE|nr:hypothetical protein QFC21_006695 [Naganishia friedmannii]
MVMRSQYIVESLSDSTIYMSYYTVAHLLQGGSLYGDQGGPLGITADQITDEVSQLKRSSFQQWYPVDVRSSGKDLTPNHLAFCIYIHAALFEEKYWPRAMRANEHLMSGGQNMFKRTGNFSTLREALDKFGADATRLTLADAGDNMTDTNVDDATVSAFVLRFFAAIQWAFEMKTVRAEGTLRSGEWNSHALAFEAEMDDLNRKTNTFYKDCLKHGYYEYQSARDWYRDSTLPQNGGEGMHVDLVFKFNALWPDVGEDTNKVDRVMLLPRLAYMRGVLSYLRSTDAAVVKKNKEQGKDYHARSEQTTIRSIFVAAKYPEWKYSAMSVLKVAFDEETQTTDVEKLKKTLTERGKLADKRVMPFIAMMKRKIKSANNASSLSFILPYSEIEALRKIPGYIKTSMRLKDVAILSAK